MSCPSCGGDDWKLASLVHKEGLSHINTTNKSLGVGVADGHVGVGAAKGNTKGIQQTELSRQAAPPADLGAWV